MRNAARRSLRALLLLLPARWANPLRRKFIHSQGNGPGSKVLRAVIYVLRYRGVPRDLRSFGLLDRPDVKLVNADSFIVEWLYWFGEAKGYEATEILWWRRFVREATGIIDLGSNIGYYALQAASVRQDLAYLAVEPHPQAASVLRENLILNGVQNVRVIEAAALPDDRLEQVELRMPVTRDHYAEAPTGSFVDQDGNLPDIGLGDSYRFSTVAVRAIDVRSLLTKEIDLIKMDVEGQELLLLRSIVDHFASVRPTLFVEVLDGALELREWIVNTLMPMGYRCFVPTTDRLIEIGAADLVGSSVESRTMVRDVILTCLDVTSWSVAT